MIPGGDKSGPGINPILNLAANTELSACKYNYRSSIDPVAGTEIIMDTYFGGTRI
jgi:hypothetical protein